MGFPGGLGGVTSSQLPDLSPVILVPLGSTEQHGPHLPLDTDTRIAVAVARAAGARLAAPVAPAVSYGASGEHQSFPGTISIGTEALTRLLIEYGRSASCWTRRLVFVNGHGGNVAALRSAVKLLRFEGRDVAWYPCAVADADAHAGHTETSLLLYLSPKDVCVERLRAGNRAPLAELMPSIRRGGVAAVSEIGVLGDPTTATAAAGELLFGDLVAGCVGTVRAWAPDGGGMLR
ncbi:MAG TPA: mycofactocin biosynthesis peptidyl-dipeptidase MftE [Mycobacterium sp.]